MEEKKKPGVIRAVICIAFVLLIFTLFVVRLYDWQIVHGEEYRALNRESTAFTEVSTATRGEILDVDGNELVANVTAYEIALNKIFIADKDLNAVVLKLITIFNACSCPYEDVLPIRYDGTDYIFTDDRDKNSEIKFIESDAILKRAGMSAQEIIEGLKKRYSADSITDPVDLKNVLSVRYNMEKKGYSYTQVYVFASNVPDNIVAAVAERTQTIHGVEIRTVNNRVIKNGTLIPHLLGVVGALNEEEYNEKKDEGYSLDDTIGKFGIESAMESYLRGKAGEKTVTKDADGNIVSEKETIKAQPGNTVWLTINPKVQAVANWSLAYNVESARKYGEAIVENRKNSNEKQKTLLGEDCYAGGAVMIDLRDFSVIAAATAPSYDLSKFFDEDYSAKLFSDEHTPMFNRAFDGAFSPGSSFKPCVALAALEEGVITENTEITCTGHYDYYKNDVVKCMGTHGSIKLNYAMQRSCNYYFAEVGRRTGITTMYLYAEKFGLGVKTGVEVGENPGVLAGRDSTTWYEGNTVQAAIGQSDNTFTPLQLATYAGTIANNGVRYNTHLVRRITDYERENDILVNDPAKPTVVADAGLSADNLSIVKEAMRAVVTDGTASDYAGRYPIHLAAKTGTAENAGSDHTTFICFAPYEKPEIAVAVVLEHGARSWFPQYVAMDMMDAYFYGKTVSEVQKNPWKNK